MEELFALLVGAGVVALMPLVPALRPMVKTVVKGGMVVMGATKAATAGAGEQWHTVVKEAKDEIHSDEQATCRASNESEERAQAPLPREGSH